MAEEARRYYWRLSRRTKDANWVICYNPCMLQLLSFLDSFEDILVTFLKQQTVLAPILLLFLEEAGLPLPIADFIISYTGYQVSLGHIPYIVAYIILLIADLTGASMLY